MRLFLLGATSRTGAEVIDQGLARGHQVTAFVRSPEKIVRRDGALRVGMDWTIARPPRLVIDPDGHYHAEEVALPPGVPFLRARLSWRAVAAFLLDALEGERYVQKTVGISW